MSRQLLFYETPVPVNATRHAKTSIEPGDYSFAREVNSVPLAAAEFAAAAAEYPIVFAGEGENVVPSVILGLDGSNNAFIAEDGTWQGSYVPAFIRRYPFVLSDQDDAGKQTLHLDEGYPGINTEGRGEALFDAEGEQTEYIAKVLAFVQEYQAQHMRTQVYARKLAELELLKPMQANFTLPSGEKRRLSGFRTVDREKLKALPEETVAEMFRTDELECTYLHLFSARHFNSLAERVSSAAQAA